MQGRGGFVGELEYYITAHTIGGAATTLLVFLGLVAGGVLVTGGFARSPPAPVRQGGRGGRTGRRTGARAVTLSAVRGGQMLGEQVRTRREVRDEPTVVIPGRSGASTPPLDGADRFPDLFSCAGTMPPSPALGRRAIIAPTFTAVRAADVGTARRPRGRRRRRLRGAPTADGDPHPPGHASARYRPPSRNVLKRSSGPSTQPASVIQETSRRLVETLGHFGVQAEVTEAVSGPRVTRYELQLAPGTKVSRVTALRDDLAYALAAREEIRIIAPIPASRRWGWRSPTRTRPW